MAFSAERLIKEVRKREILYVSSLRTYKDTAIKEKAWEEVAAELEISEEEGGGIICIIFTGWAVAQTCCISQCAKYRKSGIFGYPWEQNP